MTAVDSIYSCIAASQDINEMADTEPTVTTAKEPGPNNPEQVKAFKKATDKVLIKFEDCIHSFDHYQNKSAYEYYIHDYLNKLLRTDQSYYKDASIEPVLTTVHEKYCKIMLEKTNTENPPPFTAQSKDNIEQLEEIIHKFGHMEDFPELSEESLVAIMGMFSQLQQCHENCPKLAGPLAELGSLLQPDQFMYLMKHSLRPFVQISLPARLCSPADLKFDKLRLTTTETHEEKGIDVMLPRHFHPALAELPSKHTTRCLAAAIHVNLRRHIFQLKESQNTVAEQFQVAPKKLYEALTGKHYDPGHKLTKAEKLAKEAEKVMSTTLAMGNKNMKATGMDVDPNSEDMLPLLSNDDDNTDPINTGTKKKKLVTKKPTDKKPCK